MCDAKMYIIENGARSRRKAQTRMFAGKRYSADLWRAYVESDRYLASLYRRLANIHALDCARCCTA
ncbi:hypothetical protein ACFZCK_14130 [Kitasatospora purpeofusca]|uniref:hypothetical protein n=1 Tax=Kitasatospora purpeofusca TaxID=67352 RepID=UPI0036EB2C63